MEPGVGAAAFDQFVVWADFRDKSALDDHQPVGAAQRAQAVGNRYRRSPLNEIFQRQLNFAFGFRVDRRGGLVQDQNARIDQQCPSDADSLALAAREELASLADQRIVAVGQAKDELVGAGRAGGGDDFARVASGRP